MKTRERSSSAMPETVVAEPRSASRAPSGTNGSTLSLVRSPDAFVDRWLPRRPWPFVAVVAAIAVGFWGAGGLISGGGATWLASREWQVQPLYLAVHLALVRAFATSYASNFLAGCSYLRMEPADARRRVRRALGWRSLVVAAIVAVPLVAIDIGWASDESTAFGAADGLMIAIWALEWLLNAYVWAIVVAFLVHTMRVLKRHPFRDAIESVLREHQYRPFLLMNAQGASLTALFALASFGYVALTRGALSDYAGLWITGALVFLGFVPPWARLKSGIGAVVESETRRLDEQIADAYRDLERDGEGELRTVPELGRRVRAVLSILRVEHLDRLHGELGKSEAQATVLRLVAPAMTLAWRFLKPF
jgi:hypothetical protein